jgi:chemotaxis protein CheC
MGLPFGAPSWEALEEVVPEACRRAGASLSEFAQDPVEVLESDVREVPWAELAALVEPDVGGELVAAVLDVQGDDRGAVSLLFSRGSAENLAGLMMGQDEPWPLDEMARSALGEVGNITATAFLNVVADAFGVRLLPSTPRVLDTSVPGLLDRLVPPSTRNGHRALVVRTAFRLGRRSIDGYLLLVSSA